MSVPGQDVPTRCSWESKVIDHVVVIKIDNLAQGLIILNF